MTTRLSTIILREKQEKIKVKIGSRLKPDIVSGVIEKWQSLLNVIVKITHVPAGLIMKLNEDSIEVFLASNTPGNPYKRGEKSELVYGLYCETVIGTQQKLMVPDATKNPVWSVSNPDVDINMISYLGYPVNWPDGEVFGTICILDNKENSYGEDIEELLLNVSRSLESELRLLVTSQELEEKNARLEQSNTIKDKFFSIIAHDLKSPFNSIMGFSDLLVDKLSSGEFEDAKKYAGIILNSSERAVELLSNLMDWSRCQTGRIVFKPERLDVSAFLGEIIQLYESIAMQKSIHIRQNFNAKIHAFADKDMLSTIMRNLITNAIKFTHPQGEVTISAEEIQDNLVISVRDTGVGMSQQTMENLFRIDKNISTPGTSDEKGTGLGLILCKEFVEKHAGTIRAESQPGKGSVFTISLPVKI